LSPEAARLVSTYCWVLVDFDGLIKNGR